jgi:hypothetical protein
VEVDRETPLSRLRHPAPVFARSRDVVLALPTTAAILLRDPAYLDALTGSIPAMAVRMTLAVCAMAMLLAACGGIADKNSVMPEFLRQPSDKPVQPDPEPDVKEFVRTNSLFTTQPSSMAVSRPRRLASHRFGVCVKAVTPGGVDGEMHPITLFVSIEHGKMLDRHRATRDDHCEGESYEKVEIAK